ncbi:unnamed protein product, partial [Penicillium nalgiovense]
APAPGFHVLDPVLDHVPVLQSRCHHCQFHYYLFHAHVPFPVPAAVLVLVLGSPPMTKDLGVQNDPV